MRQPESDRLLAWTMVQTLQTAVLVEQNQRGRPLSDEEHEECFVRTHAAVEAMLRILAENQRI